MSKAKKRWLAAAVLLLLAAAWALWPDGRVAKAKALQKELFGAEGRSLSPEVRKKKWEELREVRKELTTAQKQALGAEARRKRQADMGRYFAMSPKEKEKHLDGLIRRQEQLRKNGAAKGGAGRPPGKGPPGDRSPKGRDDRRQRHLDSSTPAERAQMAAFRKDLQARRARLGLPPSPPRGGGRPG